MSEENKLNNLIEFLPNLSKKVPTDDSKFLSLEEFMKQTHYRPRPPRDDKDNNKPQNNQNSQNNKQKNNNKNEAR